MDDKISLSDPPRSEEWHEELTNWKREHQLDSKMGRGVDAASAIQVWLTTVTVSLD